MCNLCKGDRLFLISNPCCCCSLRCGTIWICLVSCAYGVVSTWVPLNSGIQWEVVKQDSPEFKGSKPFDLPYFLTYFFDEKIVHNFFHFGLLWLQIFTGAFVLISVCGRAGGFLNFIAGSLWLVARVIITIIWTPVLYKFLITNKEDLDTRASHWNRYSWFLMVNVFIHFYFFVVIRSFTMESYDVWVYRPVTPQLDFRERAPDKKTRTRGKRPRRPRHDSKTLSRFREGHEALTPVPVWRLRNKYVVLGEDYEPMDPTRFLLNWNLMKSKLEDGTDINHGKPSRKESDDEQKPIVIVGPMQEDIMEVVNEVKKARKSINKRESQVREANIKLGSISQTDIPKKRGSTRESRTNRRSKVQEMLPTVERHLGGPKKASSTGDIKELPVVRPSKLSTAKATRSVRAPKKHPNTGKTKLKALNLKPKK